MREVECVRQNKAQDEYLKQLLAEAGLSLKFITWKDSKVQTSTPLILVIDENHIEALLEICEDRDLKVIVGFNTRREFKLVPQIKDYFDKIFGFIDLSQEIDYNVPVLMNYINMNFSSEAIPLQKLASDLDEIYESTKTELTKIKDLHDRFVKVRVDKLKGVNITSKFMAGEKSGGEFFDMIQDDHNVLYLQAGSNSYTLSSLILSEMEILKFSSPTTALKSQVEHFEKMINRHVAEKGGELEYVLVHIDLKKLEVEFVIKGRTCIYLPGEEKFITQSIKIKVKPSDKFYIISSCAMKNMEQLNPQFSLENFYKDNRDKNVRDLINEFFFEVSKNKEGKFLIYDAIMSIVEVDQNILYRL